MFEGRSRGLVDEVLSDAAERIAALVGDGCLIHVRDSDTGEFIARAAGHRDADDGAEFAAVVGGRLHPSAWLAQALERGRAFAVPAVGRRVLAELGIPQDERIGEVILVPIRAGQAVAVVVRDRIFGPYTSAQRRTVEDLAARLGTFLSELGAGPREVACPEVNPATQELLEATSAALWLVDLNGVTTYVNSAASELAGWAAPDLIGVPIEEFIGRSPSDGTFAFDGGEETERRLVRGDGARRWVSVRSRPMFDEGTVTGTLFTLLDIDERRRREVRLRLGLSREAALRRFAERLIAAQDEAAAFDLAVETITEELGTELAAVMARTGSETVRALAVRGWTEVHGVAVADGSAPDHAADERTAGLRAMRTGEAVIVPDYLAESEVVPDPVLVQAGIRSAAVVPLADDRIALSAHSTRPYAIDEEAIELLSGMARLLSSLQFQPQDREPSSHSPA